VKIRTVKIRTDGTDPKGKGVALGSLPSWITEKRTAMDSEP
jgi:hypothetical protein